MGTASLSLASPKTQLTQVSEELNRQTIPRDMRSNPRFLPECRHYYAGTTIFSIAALMTKT